MELWRAINPGAWHAAGAPTDTPRVEAIGPDPDRVLMIGPGKSTGFGVHTHELGLGGHLARELSTLTERGCSVDIVSDPEMSVADTGAIVARAHLHKFDALIVSMGGINNFRMRSQSARRQDVAGLLDAIDKNGAPSLQSFILEIAPADKTLPIPKILLPIINRNIAKLNSAAKQLCAEHPRIAFLRATKPAAETPLQSRTYQRWAQDFAPDIAQHLAAGASSAFPSGDTAGPPLAFDSAVLASASVAAALNAIVHSARQLLDTDGAAITFHDSNAHQFVSSAHGNALTHHHAEGVCNDDSVPDRFEIVEDELHNARHCEPGIRFHLRYPIVQPNGDAIGALCIFDALARTGDPSHESLLHELAQRVQAALQRQ
ncbi:MAG: GAF domain-containing protein [Rhodoglobus sp.]